MSNTPYFDAYESRRRFTSPRATFIASDDLISGPITSDINTINSSLSSNTNTFIRQTPNYRLQKEYCFLQDVNGERKRVLMDVTLEMRDVYTGNWTVV